MVQLCPRLNRCNISKGYSPTPQLVGYGLIWLGLDSEILMNAPWVLTMAGAESVNQRTRFISTLPYSGLIGFDHSKSNALSYPVYYILFDKF